MNEMDNLEKIKYSRNEKHERVGDFSSYWLYQSLFGGNSKAIRSFCSECLGYTTSQEIIKDCCGFSCPLYFNRPYQYDDTQEVKALIISEEANLPSVVKFKSRALGTSAPIASSESKV